MVVFKYEFSAMQIGDGGNQAEAKAAARCGAASFQAIEAAQYRLPLVLWNAGAIIRDTEHWTLSIVYNADGDEGTRAAVTDGIFDQEAE